MKIYSNDYKNSKSGKEIKDIYRNKLKENKKFFPFLEISNEDKERSFTPELNIEIKKEQRNFNPSLKIPENKKRNFILDYHLENDKKSYEKRVRSPNDYRSQANLKENHTDIIKLRELENEFNADTFNKHLLSPNLKQLYNEYYTLTNLNANSGLKFTQTFKKFIEDHENLTGFQKEQLKYTIEKIENDNLIEKYILYLLSSTTYKIDKIIKFVKKVKGLTSSYATIKKIEKKYDLSTRESYRASNIHPNLIKDYFKTIDSKAKAYILGFLYADGWIVLSKDGTKIFGINIHPKDEYIIDHFIENVKANISKKAHYTDNRGKKIVHIDICDQQFCNYLIKQGVKPKKSLVFDFPKLKSREQSLSFLLGFFDGDGTRGTTKITSGNRKFLYQIKEKFQLDYKISKDKRKKNCYNLHLGAELFNEMLDNYKESLPRKRIKFCTEKERLERAKSACIKNQSGILSNLTKTDLEKLVWKMPFIELGKLYGCSGRSVSKKCDKFGIQKPPLGYWKRKRHS